MGQYIFVCFEERGRERGGEGSTERRGVGKGWEGEREGGEGEDFCTNPYHYFLFFTDEIQLWGRQRVITTTDLPITETSHSHQSYIV